jgi:hypothetical protein
VENGTNALLEFAAARNIKSKVVEFQTAREVQERAPSAYGVFGTVLDGQLLSYHYLQPKDFEKLASERNQGD